MHKKRIMIGIPINRWLSAKFTISLSKILHYLTNTGWTVDVNYDDGSVLSTQRNKIMRAAQKEEMDLLFIDSDMVFGHEDFEKIYNAARPNMLVGGACFMRRFPFQPAVFVEDKVDSEFVFTGMKLKDMPVYPFKCAAVGCAFLYIQNHVIEEIFDKYKYPFNHYEMENGECLGEDLSFFHRCNKMGIETICVPNVNIGHITERIVYRNDHIAALEVISENK